MTTPSRNPELAGYSDTELLSDLYARAMARLTIAQCDVAIDQAIDLLTERGHRADHLDAQGVPVTDVMQTLATLLVIREHA